MIYDQSQPLQPILMASKEQIPDIKDITIQQLKNNNSYYFDYIGYATQSYYQYIQIEKQFITNDSIWYMNSSNMNKINFNTEIITRVYLTTDIICPNKCNSINQIDKNVFNNICVNGNCICQNDKLWGRQCQIISQEVVVNSQYSFQIRGFKWESIFLDITDFQAKYSIIIFGVENPIILSVIYPSMSLIKEPNFLYDTHQINPSNKYQFDFDKNQLMEFQNTCYKLNRCNVLISFNFQLRGISELQFMILQSQEPNDNNLFDSDISIIVTILILFIMIFMLSIYFHKKYKEYQNILQQQNQQNINQAQKKHFFANKKITKEQLDKCMPLITFEQYISLYPEQEQLQECVICLQNFEKIDKVRVILCLHIFHQECIDMWFVKNESCPYCRQKHDNATLDRFIKNPNLFPSVQNIQNNLQLNSTRKLQSNPTSMQLIHVNKDKFNKTLDSQRLIDMKTEQHIILPTTIQQQQQQQQNNQQLIHLQAQEQEIKKDGIVINHFNEEQQQDQNNNSNPSSKQHILMPFEINKNSSIIQNKINNDIQQKQMKDQIIKTDENQNRPRFPSILVLDQIYDTEQNDEEQEYTQNNLGTNVDINFQAYSSKFIVRKYKNQEGSPTQKLSSNQNIPPAPLLQSSNSLPGCSAQNLDNKSPSGDRKPMRKRITSQKKITVQNMQPQQIKSQFAEQIQNEQDMQINQDQVPNNVVIQQQQN